MFIEQRDGVGLWRYRTYGGRFYVETLCKLPDEHLVAWGDRCDVNADTHCWHYSMLPSELRYMSRRDLLYWNMEVRFKRRAFSVIGHFVPYRFCHAYFLREIARDRIMVRLPGSYEKIAMPQGLRNEQEPVLSYKAGPIVDDPKIWLWMVAVTECVVRVCAGLLFDVYNEYHISRMPPDVIAFVGPLQLHMGIPLGRDLTCGKSWGFSP